MQVSARSPAGSRVGVESVAIGDEDTEFVTAECVASGEVEHPGLVGRHGEFP